MTKVFIAAFAGCAVLASAAFAAESPRRTISTQSVRTDDLDLSTEAGARQMLRRLKGAVDTVCYQPSSGVSPWIPYETWRCRRETTARAVRTLNAPLVSATFATATDTVPQNFATR